LQYIHCQNVVSEKKGQNFSNGGARLTFIFPGKILSGSSCVSLCSVGRSVHSSNFYTHMSRLCCQFFRRNTTAMYVTVHPQRLHYFEQFRPPTRHHHFLYLCLARTNRKNLLPQRSIVFKDTRGRTRHKEDDLRAKSKTWKKIN
jgi:hypothetical protein